MAFLGIRITPEIGRLIKKLEVPGNPETPSEYHITLLCFEDHWPIKEVAKALEATYDIVAKFEPFMVKSNEVAHFPRYQDQPIAIIAPLISDELHDLREKLAKEFDKNKIDFKKTFKTYKPHITLAYSDDKYDDYEIDPPIEFVVNEVVLWGGDTGDDRVFITFPLKGPEKIKHSTLMKKVEQFVKLIS